MKYLNIQNNSLKMDNDIFTEMYLRSFLPQIRNTAVTINDMTSIRTDIGKTWARVQEDNGRIRDEHIKKLEELRDNVFQACEVLIKKTSEYIKAWGNLHGDIEKIINEINEVNKLQNNMNDKQHAFTEWYSRLSITFFNEEYKK